MFSPDGSLAQAEAGEFLVSVMALRDWAGRRCGFLGFLEARSLYHAQSYLDGNRLYEASLDERTETLHFAIEVERLG